jgi:8-hydroxy-5-deazaflavin:NADPH oxidoreductase
MRIGIIGTGHMGRALGLRWARIGRQVLFGSRDLDKAKAVAEGGSGLTRASDFDAAAAFGDAILYTVRGIYPSALLREPAADFLRFQIGAMDLGVFTTISLNVLPKPQ